METSVNRKSGLIGLLLCGVMAGMELPSSAQSIYFWTNAVSGAWEADNVWSNDLGQRTPPVSSSSNVLNFFAPGPGYTAINNVAGFVLNAMNFSSSSVTLAGQEVVFAARGVMLPTNTLYGASNVTINLDLALATNTTFAAAGTGRITINGRVSGVGGLTKTGTGSLMFTGDSDYAGVTAVRGGQMILNGGVISNSPAMGVATTAGTLFAITNGGRFYMKSSAYPSVENITTFLVDGPGSLFNAGNGTGNSALKIGSASSSNLVQVSNGGLLDRICIWFCYNGNNRDNRLLVTNGGRVNLNVGGIGIHKSGGGGSLAIYSNGVYVGSTTPSASVVSGFGSAPINLGVSVNDYGNWLVVERGGVVTGLSYLAVGGSNGVANFARITDGGHVYCPSVRLGVGGLASSNTVTVSHGGLLECAAIAMANVAPSGRGNQLLVRDGGILQLTTLTPGITNLNVDAAESRIIIDNGTLSYRLSSGDVNLTNNWGGVIGASNVTWAGVNTLRLQGGAAINTLGEPYRFRNDLGSTNYNGLELFGTTMVKGAGITIGDGDPAHGGALLVSGGTVTFAGALTVDSANVLFANVTGLVASNGVVWMSGSAATTTVGSAVMSASTTNMLTGGSVIWSQQAGTTQRVNGLVTGPGSLVKTGPGTLILAASNTLEGVTVIEEGALALNGSVRGSVRVGGEGRLELAGTVQGSLSIEEGGSYSGSGVVAGAVTNAGVWNAMITNTTGGAIWGTFNSFTIEPGSHLNLTGVDFLASSSSSYTIVSATGGGVHGAFESHNLPKGWILDYSNGYVRIIPGSPATIIFLE